MHRRRPLCSTSEWQHHVYGNWHTAVIIDPRVAVTAHVFNDSTLRPFSQYQTSATQAVQQRLPRQQPPSSMMTRDRSSSSHPNYRQTSYGFTQTTRCLLPRRLQHQQFIVKLILMRITSNTPPSHSATKRTQHSSKQQRVDTYKTTLG